MTMSSVAFPPRDGLAFTEQRGGCTAESERLRSAHRAVNPAGCQLRAGHTEAGTATKNKRGPAREGKEAGRAGREAWVCTAQQGSPVERVLLPWASSEFCH